MKKIKIYIISGLFVLTICVIVAYLLLSKSNYHFELGEEQYSIKFTSYPDVTKSYKDKARTYTYTGELLKNWRPEFWNIFLSDNESDDILKDYAGKITSISNNYSNNKIELLIAFVQGSIEYDFNKAQNDDSRLQYPIETLLSKKGVCSDKSMLLAKLLIMLDYNVVLFSFPKEDHMAIGISVPKGYDSFNSGYCYIETTAYSPIGRIPKDIFKDSRIIQPELIFPINNGSKTFYDIESVFKKYTKLKLLYGDDYFLCSSSQKKLLKSMKKKKVTLDSLLLQRSLHCSGKLSNTEFEFCSSLTKLINSTTSDYNNLVKSYNSKPN